MIDYRSTDTVNASAVLEESKIILPSIHSIVWMGDAPEFSAEEVERLEKRLILEAVEDEARRGWDGPGSSVYHCWDDTTDRIAYKWLEYDDTGEPVRIRWENIHGKSRKKIKLAIKTRLRAFRRELTLYEKYSGHEDVICVESRVYFDYDLHRDLLRDFFSSPAYLDYTIDYISSPGENGFYDYYIKVDPALIEKYHK